MKYARLIPFAVLAFAAACSDTTTSPITPTSEDGPLFAVSPGTFAGTFNTANAPGHLQQGTINCVVSSTLAVTCSGSGTYQINGVGNTNAQAALSATYSGTVTCTNKGGNLVEVKTQVTSPTVSTGDIAPKNGNMVVPQITRTAPTENQFEASAVCPNGNWRKDLAPGSPTLESFTYTLHFDGFPTSSFAVFISAS